MEDEFEIPSAHEHAVEHAAEKHVPLGQEVALFSAVLVGVIFGTVPATRAAQLNPVEALKYE